jgi:cytochrome c biogenesis protein CcmG/thiol:disulfide interchange protein DsbE
MERVTPGAMFAAAALIGVMVLPAVRLGADAPRDPPGHRVLAVSSRKPAPDFAGASSAGARVGLVGYGGHVVLLDFWATWCTGCKLEIPWYIDFQKKYARAGLASVGVAMDDEGWSVVKPYLAVHPIAYPVIVSTPDLATRYDVTNLPVTVLIDRHGRMADSHLGVVDKIEWEGEIRTLLAEK